MWCLIAFVAGADASTPQQNQLTLTQAYGLVVLGILVSILLPLLINLLPKRGAAAVVGQAWTAVKPYLVIGAVSSIAAVIVLAFAGDAAKSWSWQSAVLAGYAWDSTLQKVGKP